MENKWWQKSVVYQIYPRSFMDSNGDGIGDLPGIISKLDYLAYLGIDVIWLSPVYRSPMKDNGYDIADYQNIEPVFGTMEDMDTLLEEASARGIRIIMDLVVNHTSDEHPWFLESRKSIDSPYRDYYVWRSPSEDGGVPSDLGSIFGGSAWAYDKATDMYYLHLFDASQPDLNWENPRVQEEVHAMMNWWLKRGIGGFRMDVIDLIGKEIDQKITGNGPKLHQRIQEMNAASFGDKDVLTVGETWGATPEIAKLYSGENRKELSMVFQFEHITASWSDTEGKWTKKKPDMAKVKAILIKWQEQLAEDGWNSLFWNNHDLPRLVSYFGDDSKYRIESGKMLATMLHFLKGTPFIYQGEEIGMTNYPIESIQDCNDVETFNYFEANKAVLSEEERLDVIRVIGRDNARTPMQWDSSTNGGFTTGKPWLHVNPNHTTIHAEAAVNDEDSLFHYYRRLIQLRKTYPVMVHGQFNALDKAASNTFCYERINENHQILVVCHMGAEEVEVNVPDQYLNHDCEILIGNYKDLLVESQMTLKPYQCFAVLRKH